jgi:hypothetical protein
MGTFREEPPLGPRRCSCGALVSIALGTPTEGSRDPPFRGQAFNCLANICQRRLDAGDKSHPRLCHRTAVLVRPDGYAGLASQISSATDHLAAYRRKWFSAADAHS